jgi:hypothetical protein
MMVGDGPLTFLSFHSFDISELVYRCYDRRMVDLIELKLAIEIPVRSVHNYRNGILLPR